VLTKEKLSRRDFLRLSAIVGAGTVLAACAPAATPTAEEEAPQPTEEVSAAPSEGAEKVTMTLWMNDRLYVENFQKRSEAFADAHPEYEFEFTIEENPDLWDNLVTLFVGGLEDVDIVALERGPIMQLWKGDLAEKSLVPLDTYLTPEEIEGHTRWEMFSWDGNIWAVSAEMDGVCLFYQPALFEEAGVDVDAIETYDDFIQAGQALRDIDKYLMYQVSSALSTVLASQNDGGFFSEDGDVIIDSPETIEALQLQYDMLRTDEVAFEQNDTWSPAAVAGYEEQTVAAAIEADWWSDYYLKDLLPDMSGMWRIRPLPTFRPGGRRTATLGGTGFAIVKTTPHPDLAWDFIKMTYMDKDNLVKIFLETHYFPPMKACWDDKRILEFSDPYYGDQVTGAVWAELAAEVPLDPTHEFRPEAEDAVNEQVVLVFEGEKSAEQALKDAADEVRQLIGA
jgi:arabinosaccharide transport system substrate-binding protein